MKTIILILSMLALFVDIYAQSPQAFQYQAVVRNSSGTALQNQPVGFRISILSGSPSGILVYSETHTLTTNSVGVANLSVGNGTPVSGSFSSIVWGSASHFIKVEADPAGGSSYVDMGTTQLLSVPYSLYSEKAGNAGDTLWELNGDKIFNKNSGYVGIGNSNPTGKFVIQGDVSAPLSDPLFEIKNSAGQQIMAVYNDSIHFFITDIASNKGGFAVSGRNSSKAITNDFLLINPDSTRIYTSDTIAGFAVENIETGQSSSYMHLNPSNYFIGHYSGHNVTSGLYNSTFGFKADSALNSGSSNIMIGYEAGKHNIWGSENVFMGFQSGYSNSIGGQNVFIGYQSGYTYTGQYGAVCIGTGAGKFSSGPNNVIIGRNAGMNSTGGSNNILIGASAGGNFTGGNSVIVGTGAGAGSGGWNTFLGCNVAEVNTTGNYNLFAGWRSADDNTTGSHNVFLGYYSGRLNTTGSNNTYVGDNAGYSSVTGAGNVCLGYMAGYSQTASNKLFIENSTDVTNPLVNGDFSTNRIAFHRTATTYPLQVGTTTTNGNGAYLTTGGVWTAGSSRSFKDRFKELNSQEILEKISGMELKGWYYKNTQEYHIGPFAEDFYNAFGTGVLDVKEDIGHYLSATDVAGVGLVAIQQLIKENKEQKILINQLLERIENLENKTK